MTITLSALQKQRRDTAANWTAENPTLLAGEIGIEADTGKIKIGNGSSAWASLGYQGIIPASGTYPLNQLIMPLGTAGAPPLTFTGDVNTGIYSPGTDQLALATGGTGRIFVNAAGNTGIGTATTSVPLTIQADSGQASIRIAGRSADGLSYAEFTNNAQTLTYGYFSSGPTYLAAGTGTTEAIRINSAGLVGVGTSSPGYPLDVQGESGGATLRLRGGSGGSSVVQFTDNAVSAQWGTIAATSSSIDVSHGSVVRFLTNSSERARIDSSGRLGIGTTSPINTLDVIGKASFRPQTSGDYGIAAIQGNTGAAAGITIESSFGSGGYGPMIFQVNNGEAARFDSSRRLLVGTSSARANFFNTAYSARIQVEGTDYSTAAAAIICNSASEASIINLARSRGTTTGSNTVVQSGDILGIAAFQGSDGAEFVSGAEIKAEVDGTPGTNDMPGRLVFSTTPDSGSSPVERLRIGNNGSILFNTTAAAFGGTTNLAGIPGPAGVSGLFVQGYQTTVCELNRQGNDGVLITFFQDIVAEGSISISGTTVSYNGAHLSRWSQLPGGVERTEILRGTVLSNIDEMCDWTDEENEQLNRMKVSDAEGDKNVSGVFQAWDDDDDTYTNDFYCAMTGDFIIRIGAGVTVERGDLLMSAGDGTAKPQDDDIIRSKTIAKVTSTNVSCTYPDGSYCVPCVLMAC